MLKWVFNLTIPFIILSLLGACASVGEQPFQPKFAGGDIHQAAAAQVVADQFLSAWQIEDYETMYGLLSRLSQDAINLEDFINRYRELDQVLTLQDLEYQLLSAMVDKVHVQVAYQLEFETLLVGTLTRETLMNLVQEDSTWRIQWEIGMIMPDLRDGNTLEFVYDIPARGRIYDRHGSALAAYENAIALGLVPGEILPEQADQIYEILAELSIYESDDLAEMVDSTPADWYLPIVSLSQEKVETYLETLSGLSGVRIDSFRSRYYVDGGVAPHALGYMLFIPEEKLDAYLELGYRQDERIGAAGLEAVYEEELAGKRGGSLYLVGPDGEIRTLLASQSSEPGQSLYTSLDKTLQMRLQESLGDLRAAVVVMEVDTGRVLALVSNPAYDPNVFDFSEIDRGLLESYFSDEDQPLFNRATQGQYPLGSVFKIITMATALESGVYRAGSSFLCGHSLWVCDSVTLYDWTYDHGVAASGELTLLEGLMRSCNPWFYRIGETLYAEGMEAALMEMARGFGLGSETGIDIPEESGSIPEEAISCVNNAQLAIGQGEMLVTPLQVATFISAVANGGTLYRPALVEKIEPGSGPTPVSFSPQLSGKLPISEETLSNIQDALRMVVADPRGTAFWALQDLDVLVSGKTGTAQTPSGNSHAWFAGYTHQKDPQHPDIAVVVLIENGGEGSAVAAPVFRRTVSLYFTDGEDPGGTMPWEVAPYELFVPTLTPSETLPSDE